VTHLWIEEGAPAAEGDAILELDPVRRQLELEAAKARVSETRAGLHEARREVRRLSELRKNKISSMAALQKAETKVRLAESRHSAALAEFGVAQRALSEATVRAPFSGMLVERKVSLGEYVQLGTPLVELVSLDPIEVVFSVAEVDSSRVHKGQRVMVSVAPYPDEEFEARVDVVSPTIDPNTRTLRVKARLDNSDGRLRPGLFARADLGVSQRIGVPVISDIAVLQRTDGAVVFTLDPTTNRVERRVIEIGGFQEGKIEIAAGLLPGELVLTKGHPSLADGALVRRLTPQPSAPSVAAKPRSHPQEAAEVSVQ
jgi:membrane fusion protein (multidrug efflux system)